MPALRNDSKGYGEKIVTPSMMIARLREIYTASPQDTLENQRLKLKDRKDDMEALWNCDMWMQSTYPNGLWEMDEGFWCFCAYKPEGHFCEEPDCLFFDGQESSLMCPCCRQPAQVKVYHEKEWRGYYGSAPAYENVCEVTTACCGEEPVLPNGSALSDATIEDLR